MANDFSVITKNNNESSATSISEQNLNTYFLFLQNNKTFFSNFNEV